MFYPLRAKFGVYVVIGNKWLFVFHALNLNKLPNQVNIVRDKMRLSFKTCVLSFFPFLFCLDLWLGIGICNVEVTYYIEGDLCRGNI